MPRVICTLPNAADMISGVRFYPHDRGVISEEISEEQAARFARIPGYSLVAESKKPVQVAEEASVVADSTETVVDDNVGNEVVDPENREETIEELRERAAALGIKVDKRWGRDRLISAIADADGAGADEDESVF